MSSLSILSIHDKADFGMVVYLITLVVLFISVFLFPSVQKIFASKFLVFIGYISYPLYLIHENMLISLVIKINKSFPSIPDLFLPVISSLFLVLISYIISKYMEPIAQKFLKKKLDFIE